MNMEKQAKKFMKGVKSNFNKAKRTYSCRTLKDLIRAYRACTSKSEERALVKKEAAHIRDLFREGDRHFQRRNITKLLFFHMNGYPTDFGITECIKLCASSNFADKRVAYLGLTILVDETEQILMLMTNSLKQDLNNVDINIVLLALNVVGDVASPEMLRDLLPDIEKHMQSPNPQIRKKAGLAAVRAVRKLPADDTPSILEYTPAFFDTRSSAVHISGAALVSALCEQHPSNAIAMHQTVLPIIISILTDHINGSQSSRPSDLYGSTHEKENPFLLAKLITALRSLLQHAPGAVDVQTAENIGLLLVELAGKIESAGGAGRNNNLKMIQCSILYEIVRTSAYVRAYSPELRQFITQILGRFLAHKEATVRYIALQELNALADVDGVSALAEVSQLDDKLLSSLREADRTVRRQGAELVFRTTDATNVQKMVSEMANYISLSDADSDYDSVRDGCEKLFLMADQYGRSDEWKLDVFVNALTLGHHHVSDALNTCLVSFISAHKGVRPHAVRALFEAVLRPHSTAAISAMKAHATNAVSLLDSDGISSGENVDTKNSQLPLRRMPRAEAVAMYVVGEFGSVGGLSSMDVVNACEALLFGIDGVVETCNEDEDAYARNVSAVNAAALSALLKVAARELGATQGQSGGFSNDDGGLVDMFAGLGIPALPAPPTSSSSVDVSGGATAGGQGSNAGADLAMQLITMGEAGHEDKGAGTSSNTEVTDLVAIGLGDDTGNSNQQSGIVTLYDGNSGVNAEGGPVVAKIRNILSRLVTSPDVELQQRACEYLSLLDNSAGARTALGTAAAPAPTMQYQGVRAVCNQLHSHTQEQRTSRTRPRARGTPVASSGTGNAGLLLDLMNDDNEQTNDLNAPMTIVDDDDPLAALGALVVADPQPLQTQPVLPPPGTAATSSTPMDDLFALSMGGGPDGAANTTGPKPTVTTAAPQEQGLDSLMGLGLEHSQILNADNPLELTVPIPDATPKNQPAQTMVDEMSALGQEQGRGNADVGERFVITESDGMRLEVILGAVETVGDETCRRGEMSMTNVSGRPVTDCVLQLAVPKYMRLEMDPASASEAEHGGSIGQTVRMFNRAHGTKPFQFRYIVGFRLDGDEELTRLQGLADNLP